ncbi:MAG TPA: sugar-binding protein, partial [Bacillota bacterium]|nr:sugar-binding protein [Bacillota bacterium]
GWSADNTANAFERNRNADQRLDTGNKLQPAGQSLSWQILVPNGVYDVVLVAADPADTNGLLSGTRYNINVENARAVIDGVPSSSQWSFHLTRHLQVAVDDGLLTISNGPNATNNSLSFVEIRQVAPIYWGAAIIDNANTHKCPVDYGSESNPGVLGYYEGHTGKKISLVHWGNGSSSSLTGQTNYLAKMWARGTIPVYGWAPSTDSLTNIIAGKQDTYLSNWFACAKAYGKPFFLNFAREMNGTWYTWSEGNAINAGCPPGSFTNMWRHVHDLARRVGCTNVTWIWVVDRDLNNSKHLQPIRRFYPGDDYVDWVGMDIYNAGQVAPYTGESFTSIYGPTYSNVVAIAPAKPLMVCETATEDLPATPKPAWIADALALMPSAFPNIRGFLWFNWNDADVSKNYPIEGGNNSQPYTTAPVDWASVGAFSNGIASPYYLPNLFANQANVGSSPIQPVCLLEAPINVNASPSNGCISVAWSAVPEATHYAVYRGTGSAPITWQATTGATSFTDTAVTNGTTYRYVIRARNLAGESLGSTNIASATPFSTNATVVARRVTSPILVDGDLPAPTWNLDTLLAKPTIGTPNNTARFGVLWDSNYLYVGIQVLDSVLVKDSVNVSDDDSVDIYIDGTHNQLTIYDSNDRFFQKGWNNAALRESGGRLGGVRHAWANIPGGYNLELAIPWTNFNVTPAPDMTIGFDIANNDDDDGGARNAQCVWAGNANNWLNTSAFGDLYLSGQPATPITNATPASLVAVAGGQLLDLSWPADHSGWQLQSQTNPPGAGLGTNWVSVPGSASTNRLLLPLAPTNGSSFFRLAWPAP